MKLSDFIQELQEIESAEPGKDVYFCIQFRAGDSELREEVTLLNASPGAITFTRPKQRREALEEIH